jgi:succinoglycan biosynthesis transport protein ExoP
LYESMMGRMKNAALASALRASNVRVVDPARQPTEPHRPNVPLHIGAGLVGGFLLSMVVVLAGVRKTDSLEHPGQAIQYLELPELGAVPSAPLGRRSFLPGGKQRSLLNGQNALGFRLNTPESEPAPELHAWNAKPSLLTDSFQTIVASLQLSSANRYPIVVVTSPQPKDGKTTVVSHLGIALAKAGQQVLLIDADSRAGRLNHVFAAKNGYHPSASNGDAGSHMIHCEPYIHKTHVPGLSIMAGCNWEPETVLMHFESLRETFDRLRKVYQTILIDTPPMLLIPSARVLGRLADGVVLVLRARKTSFDDALACSRRLADDDIFLLGTVLNDWKADMSVYQGYYTSRS